MSDRLLSGRGQYLSKTAKSWIQSFTCVVLKVQTLLTSVRKLTGVFFLYKNLYNKIYNVQSSDQ